jgi:spermidine synthase
MHARSRRAFGLLAASGFAAMSWEILWQAYSGFAVGVSAESVALTIAVMMAGMTIGAAAGGTRLNRLQARAGPFFLFAVVEMVIAALGFMMPWGFAAVARMDAAIFRSYQRLAVPAQILLIVAVIGPPAMAMGFTVPLMKPLARKLESSLVALYAMNAIGALLGIFAQTFLLIPHLGLRGSGAVIACLNLVVALGALRMGRSQYADSAVADPSGSRSIRSFGTGVTQTLAFASGFVTFALEVAWFRSLKAAFQSTTDSFALMLAGFLAPIALGATLATRIRPNRTVIASAVLAGGLLTIAVNPLVDRIDLWTLRANGYWVLLAERAALVLLLVGLPVLCISLALPLLLSTANDAAEVGRVYAINTLGCVVGALTAAWIMLPAIAAYSTVVLCGGAFAVFGAFLMSLPRWRAGALAVAALVPFIGIKLGSGVSRIRVQAAGMSQSMRPLVSAEGADATVSVAVDAAGHRQLIIDGFQTAGEAEQGHYMAWMGRLPMLLHAQATRALVICFGTGQTANAVRRERPDHIDVVELSPEVIRFAPYFASNEAVLDDPRVRVIRTDGRAWLRRSDAQYDVITLEPMEPHFAGTNDLYSIEFYRAAASHMDDQGVIAQWLPLHLLLPSEAASVTKTFVEVFPNSALWIDPRDHTGILVGRRSDSPPIERSRKRSGSENDRDLTTAEVDAGFGLRGEQLKEYAAPGQIISDDNQLLAYGSERRRLWRFGSHERNHRLNLEIIFKLAAQAR